MAWYTAIALKARQARLRFWLTFAVAFAVAQSIEIAAHHVGVTDGKHPLAVQSLMAVTGLYQMIVTAPKQPAVRNTALVVIDHERDTRSVTAANMCLERELIARLLIRIARERPKVIVIDKYFDADRCPAGDSSTLALIDALKAIGRHFPAVTVIAGARAVEVNEIEPPPANSLASHYVEETLDLGKGVGAPVTALLNISWDHRKLPLQWYVYPDAAAAVNGRPVTLDALAFAAAKRHSPSVEWSVQKTGLLKSGYLPFVGFITPAQFDKHRLYASEVVCGRRLAINEDWRTCAGTAGLPLNVPGKVVVIGDLKGDQHVTIVGTIAGVYLQANYIEALLDERFLKPAGVWSDVLFSLAFLILLDLALVVFHESVARAVLSVAVLCLVAVAILYLTALLGIYVDPSLITGAAVLIKISHLVYSWVPRTHQTPGREPPEAKRTTNDGVKLHRGRSPSSRPQGPDTAGAAPPKPRRRRK